MKMNLQGILKNKYVLYAVSALAVVNVLGYLSIGSMECLGVFALAALVCQQYTKNMTVCLLGAIFAANVIFGCGRIKENFEGLMEGAVPGVDPEEVAGVVHDEVKAKVIASGGDPKTAAEVADCAAYAAAGACETANCKWTPGDGADDKGSCASA